ncbi:hypothetical protein, partial [Shewanella sairae]|uniref:hypothetical protein n=1 Tax=Shewanella sairae TaxID=190310 RepID=UPI001C81DA7F
ESIELPKTYNTSCSTVIVNSQLLIKEYPELDEFSVNAEVFSKDTEKLLVSTFLDISQDKKEKENIGMGCLPINTDFRVKLTFNYRPSNSLFSCSKSFVIEDLRVWLKNDK